MDLLCVIFAVAIGFIVPDWPFTKKWLSEEEKALVVLRPVEDAGEEEEEIRTSQALKMAVTDYRVWLCILGQLRERVLVVLNACLLHSGLCSSRHQLNELSSNSRPQLWLLYHSHTPTQGSTICCYRCRLRPGHLEVISHRSTSSLQQLPPSLESSSRSQQLT